MKSIKTLVVVASLLVAAIAMAQSTADLQAQNAGAKSGNHIRYVVTDLGTVPNGDGVNDAPYWITNNGLAVGVVSLPGFTSHAALWSGGKAIDLGTLGGPDSWAFGVNLRGQASGWAETGISDPNGEDYCGFGTHLICRGFTWQNGVMTALSTLGGNNSAGSQINNRGEVAGYAENAMPDLNCPAPQMFQFKLVLWRANGEVVALPIFPGDSEGAALGINENGQTVGTSGSCGPFNGDGLHLVEAHALSWKNGNLTDLGNLGGSGGTVALGNAAYSANSRGDVVGHSDLPGDITTHVFLWTSKTGMQDLGTLPGDSLSFALSINNSGEIVGVSLSSFSYQGAHGVLWENGVPSDLNTLVIPGGNAGLYLGYCTHINDGGDIVGWGMTSGGDLHAFLATPVHGADALPPSPAPEPPALSNEARKQLQQMGRFEGGMLAPQ